jgi:hypothetical protein
VGNNKTEDDDFVERMTDKFVDKAVNGIMDNEKF